MSVQRFIKHAKYRFLVLLELQRFSPPRFSFSCVLFVLFIFSTSVSAQTAFIRINQAGYLPSDEKKAIAFSKTPLDGDFVLLDAATENVVYRAPLKSVPAPNWGGAFSFYYELDFSAFKQTGRNVLRLENGG